jgi:nucleotide-binding universal stress UspA family protein
MFRHILVPTDLTEKSLKALQVAAKMGCYEAARITLLHVIETIEGSESGEFDAFYQRLEQKARKSMQAMLAACQPNGMIIDPRISYGKRVREIVRYSECEEVDLIVLSSHRVSAEGGPQAWGTISYKVGILSNCPVMLVK